MYLNSRHIVRLVRSTPEPDSEIYAVKETVQEFAVREYEALKELGLRGAPSVSQIAVVDGRRDAEGNELPCAIVTRLVSGTSILTVLFCRSRMTVHPSRSSRSAIMATSAMSGTF